MESGRDERRRGSRGVGRINLYCPVPREGEPSGDSPTQRSPGSASSKAPHRGDEGRGCACMAAPTAAPCRPCCAR